MSEAHFSSKHAEALTNQLFAINKNIHHKKLCLDEMKALATKTTSTITDMPRPETPDPQRLENLMVKIADAENDIQADMKAMSNMKAELAGLIASLHDYMQMRVMSLRYLEFKPLETIAEELDISVRRVQQIRSEAMTKLENLEQLGA